jgi:GT2 family glycosyltransferase
MNTSKIYILTATYNDLEYTKKFLTSIFSQSFKNFEVFLVDDGSSDGTFEYVTIKYPQVNILRGDGNLWWTGSLNLGLKKILKDASENDYVWIINNDCFFNKNILHILYKFAAGLKSNRYIIGSVVKDAKNRIIWDKGVKINWSKMKFSLGGTDALSTKGTLYPVGIFKEIGLFDSKHFPHYFSDYEFAIRAKRNGYKLLICNRSKIYNRTERTGIEGVSKESTLFEKFKLLFSKKSKLNLVTQINMIRYVCPPEYRFENYLLLLSKLVNGKK